MQEQSTMYWKPKRSPVRRILLVLLIVQIICAEIVAGMYLWRTFSKPVGYGKAEELAEQIDYEKLWNNRALLFDNGFTFEETEYSYFYRKNGDGRSLSDQYEVEIYMDIDHSYDLENPFFHYRKEYNYTFIPDCAGYTLLYYHKYFNLVIKTYDGNRPSPVLRLLDELVELTAS